MIEPECLRESNESLSGVAKVGLTSRQNDELHCILTAYLKMQF
jgi:hypothetical protein